MQVRTVNIIFYQTTHVLFTKVSTTCKKINRKCEEVADDEMTEEDGEEKAWEKASIQ